MIDKRKTVQTTPSAPAARAECTCPTIIQISRKPQHWKFTLHHHTTQPPLLLSAFVLSVGMWGVRLGGQGRGGEGVGYIAVGIQGIQTDPHKT